MRGLLLMLGAALGLSAFDVIRKLLTRTVPALPLTALLVAGPLPLLLAWALWDGVTFPDAGYLLPGLAALGTNLLGGVLYLRAVHASPLSATIPLLALTPVFSTLVGQVLLGEGLLPWQWLGVTVVALGALVLNGRTADLWAPQRLFTSLTREVGSLFMLAAAGLWGAGSALDKVSMLHASPAVHAALQALGALAVLLIILRGQHQLHDLLRVAPAWRTYALGIAISTVASLMQLSAFQVLNVGLAEGMKRALGMSFSVVMGRLVFAEAVTLPKALAVMMMAAGLALLLT